MTVKHEIALDVSRSGVQCTVSLTQHDVGVHRLIFRLRNGGNPLELSDKTIAVMFVEGDLYESCTCYAGQGKSGGLITCDLSPTATANDGTFKAVLQIFEGEETLLYSPEIALFVRRDLTGGTHVLESTPYASVVKAQLEAQAHAANAAEYARDASGYASDALRAADRIEDSLEVSNVTYASIIKGTASGTPSVSLDDVSPFEHTMKVNVSGFNDHTAIKLYRQGKNFLRFDDGTYVIPVGSTGRKITMELNSSRIKIDFDPSTWCEQADWIDRIKPHSRFFLPAGSYRFQVFNVSRMDKTTCTFGIYDSTDNSVICKFQGAIQNSANAYAEFALTAGKQVYLYMYVDNTNSGKATYEADMMLYSLSSDNEFMPYVPPVAYDIEADGTVRGVTSLFPGTVLFTDDPNDSSTVTCEYFKDTGKVISKLTTAIRRLGGTVAMSAPSEG